MWQRWNQNTHIFEKSTNNGAAWTPLGLNAAIITEGNLAPDRHWPTVAYTDVAKTWSQPQTFSDATRISGNNGYQIWHCTAAPVNGKVIRLLNYADGNFRFEFLNDALSAVTSTPLLLHANGSTSVGVNLHVGTGIYTYGRGFPDNYWQGYTYPGLWCSSGASFTGSSGITCFRISGKSMCLNVQSDVGNVGAPNGGTYLYISLPPGYTIASLGVNWYANVHYFAAGQQGIGLASATPGATYIAMQRDISGTAWPTGAPYYIRFQMEFQIV